MKLMKLKELIRDISKALLEKEDEILDWVLVLKKIKTIYNTNLKI